MFRRDTALTTSMPMRYSRVEGEATDGSRRTSGMSYRVLALDPYSKHMSLPVLRAIVNLVREGAVIAGLSRVMIRAWQTTGGIQQVECGIVWRWQRECIRLAKARSMRGESGGCLCDAKWRQTFSYSKPETDARLFFVHRRLADGDLYFVDNRGDREETVDATFRVTGKQRRNYGMRRQVKPSRLRTQIADGRTTVPLHLDHGVRCLSCSANRKDATRLLPELVDEQLATVDGPWTVSFEPGSGAPASVTLDSLSFVE